MQSDSRVQIVHDLYAPHCHSYHMDGSCYRESIKIKSCLRMTWYLKEIPAELGRCFKQFPGESLPNHMKYGLLNIHVRSCDPQQKEGIYTVIYFRGGWPALIPRATFDAQNPAWVGMVNKGLNSVVSIITGQNHAIGSPTGNHSISSGSRFVHLC